MYCWQLLCTCLFFMTNIYGVDEKTRPKKPQVQSLCAVKIMQEKETPSLYKRNGSIWPHYQPLQEQQCDTRGPAEKTGRAVTTRIHLPLSDAIDCVKVVLARTDALLSLTNTCNKDVVCYGRFFKGEQSVSPLHMNWSVYWDHNIVVMTLSPTKRVRGLIDIGVPLDVATEVALYPDSSVQLYDPKCPFKRISPLFIKK